MDRKGKIRCFLPTGEVKTFIGSVEEKDEVYKIILEGTGKVIQVSKTNSVFEEVTEK